MGARRALTKQPDAALCPICSEPTAEGIFGRVCTFSRFAAQAASELADISYGLTETGKATWPQAVLEHHHNEFKNRHLRDLNSCNRALYEALRDSDWFCQLGYLLMEAKL